LIVSWCGRFLFFVVPRHFLQDIGKWPENQILIPDWTYFHCPGTTPTYFHCPGTSLIESSNFSETRCKNLSKPELPEKGVFGKKISGTNKIKPLREPIRTPFSSPKKFWQLPEKIKKKCNLLIF